MGPRHAQVHPGQEVHRRDARRAPDRPHSGERSRAPVHREARPVPHEDRLLLRPRRAAREGDLHDGLRRREPAADHELAHAVARARLVAGRHEARVPVLREGHAGPVAHRKGRSRQAADPGPDPAQRVPVVLSRREDDRVLRQRPGQHGDLHRPDGRLLAPAPDRERRDRLHAPLVPERPRDRVHVQPAGLAADLHHGSRGRERPARDPGRQLERRGRVLARTAGVWPSPAATRAISRSA